MTNLLFLEYSLTALLNKITLQFGWLSWLVWLVAVGLIFGFFIFYGLSFFIDWPFFKGSGKILLLEGVLAGATTWIFHQFISVLFFRVRPFVKHEDIVALVNKDFFSKSFPSDHAGVAMALATLVFLWSPKVGVWFIFAAGLIGLSRVMAGIHYPSDIIMGFMVGAIIGVLIHKLFV